MASIGRTIGPVFLILAASKGTSWGWGSPLTLGLFGIAALTLLLWGMWKIRTNDPLVNLHNAIIPRVLLTNIASIFVGFGMYASTLVMPQILQPPARPATARPVDPRRGPLDGPGRIDDAGVRHRRRQAQRCTWPEVHLGAWRCGHRAWLRRGTLRQGKHGGLLATGIVFKTGVALVYSTILSIIMSAVPRSETAAANGLNTLMRSLGTTTGASVFGLVLAQMTTEFGGARVPSESGFRVATILGAGISLIAAIRALCNPAAAKRAPQEIDAQRENALTP